ncbi:MAG: DUF1501 domain-containing protein [Bryobacteraceae bacterium]|nr:DUF1501 domain-containing protein [Bryobacteraceae bacterium]
MPIKKCSGHLTRRNLLLSAATLSNFGLLREAAYGQISGGAVQPKNSAKACIFINLDGAPSQLDTFDPKDGPWNPSDADIREYAGGVRLSRTYFPSLSRIPNDLCQLRSIVSQEAAHERGQFYLQTSHTPNPAFASETPHLGAVCALEKATSAGRLPPFFVLNARDTQGSAMLGGRVAPFRPSVNANGLGTLDHCCFGDQSRTRFDQRIQLLERLEAPLIRAPLSDDAAVHSQSLIQARGLMYNESMARVFRFTPDEDRRYGASNFGRSMILARNAIRARDGAVFVSVVQGGWDTHVQMFDRGFAGNFYRLASELDQALGALVEDLKATGDFSQTLIVAIGEFGRTPGILNARGGRDHHKEALSALMLGGGVRGGQAIGATDKDGDQVVTPGWAAGRPVAMEDIACTIYSALGINWTKVLTNTPSGRIFQFVPGSREGNFQPVNEVFG